MPTPLLEPVVGQAERHAEPADVDRGVARGSTNRPAATARSVLPMEQTCRAVKAPVLRDLALPPTTDMAERHGPCTVSSTAAAVTTSSLDAAGIGGPCGRSQSAPAERVMVSAAEAWRGGLRWRAARAEDAHRHASQPTLFGFAVLNWEVPQSHIRLL